MTKPPSTGPAWPETLIGLGLLGVAALVWWQTGEIRTSPMYAKVGPRIFPYLTAIGLGAMVLKPWLDRPRVWQIIDGTIALIMWLLAAKLLIG